MRRTSRLHSPESSTPTGTRFEPRRGDATAWVIGIARNCVVDAAARGETPSDDLPELAVIGHEDDSLRRVDLRAAVAQLDERDRELVALRYGSDLTARQIGDL